MTRPPGFVVLKAIFGLIVIGAIITTIVVGIFFNRREARVERAIEDLRAMEQAAELYYKDTGLTPPRDDDWRDECERRVFVTGIFPLNFPRPKEWQGPYIAKWPRTPWGGTYQWADVTGDYTISILDVPLEEARMIDDRVDNSDLTTGLIRMRGRRFEYWWGGFRFPLDNNKVTAPCSL